jgi:hypothetical protein
VGTGDRDVAEQIRTLALDEAPELWMPGSMNDQVAKLEALLAKDPLRYLRAGD